MDLLDYYAGKISSRRMCLLVLQDRARMPRLRAALSGLDPWQPLYTESDYIAATQADWLQAIQRTMHTAHRMTPKLKKFQAYPRPGEKAKAPVGPPKLTKKQLSYLEQFAPAA